MYREVYVNNEYKGTVLKVSGFAYLNALVKLKVYKPTADDKIEFRPKTVK